MSMADVPYLLPPPLAALPPWPLNVRVGANSPSLCPTMSSVTYSLMKARPLWIAKFLPTNSGTIVHARAQVLIGSRLPDVSARATFSSSRSTTYGPFFSDRPIADSSPVGAGSVRRSSAQSGDLRALGRGTEPPPTRIRLKVSTDRTGRSGDGG